ncbi:MAG: folate family ECF transporter S component [Ruminococcaceae bacterium]|nr:folate family ECF transporter S component [Oscillospiraceae bacterium]
MQHEAKAAACRPGKRGFTHQLRRDLTVFGNLRVLCLAAMLAAMGVVLGYIAKLLFGTGPLRITFENLPIIFGGVTFGPFMGAAIALISDLCSCLFSGQGPNPLIAVGSASIGLLSGFLGNYLFRRRRFFPLLLVELLTHLVGSVTVKSLALHAMGYAWPLLLPRIPIYIGIACCEAALLRVLLQSQHLIQLLEKVHPSKKERLTMTYDEAIAYIHSVSWKGSRPGLTRMTELLGKLGNPQDKLRFIHVAGTNGKGSFCAMTESILRAAGYKTGLFVSPYIKDFNERICVAGAPIGNEDLARATAIVRPVADSMADAPTEFELITAIGFVHFLSCQCDIVVLETGMGGRLDSTNVIKAPLFAVITGIAMDHMSFLGDTVEKIAAEKAGIIKPGAPVLWGGRDAAARRVIADRAAEMGCTMIATEDTPLTVREMTLSGTVADYGEWQQVRLPLLGSYQPRNLANVLAAVPLMRGAGLSVSDEAVRAGLATARWPGRFEKLCENPLIFSDGAHNPEGVEAAVESIKTYFPGEKVLLLLGVMADKDYRGMVEALAPVAAEAFTLTPDNPRSLPAADFAKAFAEGGVPATAFDTVEEAVRTAVARAKETGKPLISLGSLYMYCEVTNALEKL